MNGTELKTLRQSLFMSTAEAARLHGVNERVYRYWESGAWAVPEDVRQRLEKLDEAADTIADNIADAITNRLEARLPPPALFVFACDEDLWTMTRKTIFNDYLHGIPASVYAAGIDRARQDIKRSGERVRIVTMDRDAYQAWLDAQGETDSGYNRSAWAATVTDPPTRAKKLAQAASPDSGQASGEQKSA